MRAAGLAGAARGGGHAEPGRDGLVTNLHVGEPRRDRLRVPSLAPVADDEDRLEHLVGTSWPDLQPVAAVDDRVAAPHRRPATDILLPRIDEHTVGQLLQMLMLATAVEAGLGGAG